MINTLKSLAEFIGIYRDLSVIYLRNGGNISTFTFFYRVLQFKQMEEIQQKLDDYFVLLH